MKKNIQIILLLFIQLNSLGYCYSQNQDNIYTLNINVKNLNEETIDTANVTVIQLDSSIKQSVSYSEACRCYQANNLELGRIMIRVESQGYDTQEVYHMIHGSKESVSIILGKTNSKYFLINSNKYPFETNGETVAICSGSNNSPKAFFQDHLKGDDVLVLKSGWYKLESISAPTGTVYLIRPNQNQQQGPLLADLRRLYPDKPIGILVSISDGVNILLNSCDIAFHSGVKENEIEEILKNAGAKDWEIISGSAYTVTFSENSGLDLLKITENLSVMKEIRSISNKTYSANIPGH